MNWPVCRMKWLRGKLLPFAEDAIFHSRLVERDLIDYDYVREMFRAYVAGEYDNSFFLWALINLSKWYDYWLAGKRG